MGSRGEKVKCVREEEVEVEWRTNGKLLTEIISLNIINFSMPTVDGGLYVKM